MTSYANYPSLKDKVVVITGGATGIGACLVERFVSQGAQVGFIDVDAAAGTALAAHLAVDASTAPLFVEADLTDIVALRQAIQGIRSHFGPIQVLLNNAANDRRLALESVTPNDWDRSLDVNLRHQFFAAQAVWPDMQGAGGGSIINFGSTSWMLKQGGMPSYTTSKAAIQGLTRSLARDMGMHGVRVNTLVPGWVMTEKQLRLWVDDAAKVAIAKGQCINQPVMADHIAGMALFLASDDSAMCTAQDFIVDGGWV